MLAKIITFLLTIFYLLLTPLPAFAQTANPSPFPASNLQLPTSISPTSPIYTDILIHNTFHSFSCLAVGSSVIGQPCLTYQFTKNAQGALQGIPVLSQVNLQGGTLGATLSLIGALYANPPVRTADYLASVGTGLGIVKEANAQGVVGSGQAVLSPIVNLWQVSRNIAYIIMTLMFVIIGLMVLFRQRINPQTVITAQAAIPGLVLGLVLITFSYFLAGFISDTAFLGTNLVGAYFNAVRGPTSPPQNLTQELDLRNLVSIVSTFAGKITTGQISTMSDQIIRSLDTTGIMSVQMIVRMAIGIMAYQLGSGLGSAFGGLASAALFAAGTASATAPALWPAAAALAPIAAAVTGPLLGSVLAGIAFTNPSFALGIALYLAALFAVLYAMFRLFLNLLNNYLSIIFLTVTAPFHFLFATLPGRQEFAISWIRNMLSNVLAFPAVIAVLYFAAFLLGQSIGPLRVSSTTPTQSSGLVSSVYAQGPVDIVGNNTLPLFGGLDLSFIKALLAFGAILATPKIPEIISRAIGQPGAGTQLIGQGISEATGSGQRYAGQTSQQFGAAAGNYRENWRTWKGQNPYGSKAREFQDALGGRVLPPILRPTEQFIPPGAPPGPGVGGGGGAAPCLPADILISTPSGIKPIKDIHQGDAILTKDLKGQVKSVSIIQVIKRKVLKGHQILWLVLADGRQLFVSPGHPDALGKDLALLKKGDFLDGSLVINTKLLPYHHQYTYDILPEGETGSYFANNILIGSTLKFLTANSSVVNINWLLP